MHRTAKIAVTALAIAAVPGLAAAETKLTISSWAPPNHPLTKEVVFAWAATVEKASNGRIKFQILPKHPSAPAGTIDAVRDGLVDVSFITAGYLPARFVLTLLPELPGGGTNATVNSVAYSRIHFKYFEKVNEYKGVKLLAVWTHGPGQMFNTKRPINSVADLKGLKFRVGGGMAQKMAQALGVTSFVKPSTESYELLSTGVADGIFFPLESVPAFKLEKIVKYATLFPGGFYGSSFGFFMNQDKFKKLPKEDQAVILAESGEKLARIAGEMWDRSDKRGLDIIKQSGVAIADASPALIKEVEAKAAVIKAEWIKAAKAKGIDGTKVLAEFHAELKKVAAGQ
ncbi:MAG: TRAP transporter substrate-binding protein [Rhodospirillaceae bacterium]|nr:TRAP transporter substrate-binding protein [Rhodospirillaceae bacterium]